MLDIILVTIVLAVLFDVSNGWNDSANSIATVISTRVLTPQRAVVLAATMNVLGALVSTEVAKTIGTGVVDASAVDQVVVASALVTGFLWNTIMTVMGLPVSASHALIGSLVGAAAAFGGWGVLNFVGLKKILLSLLFSPLIGLAIGYLLMRIILLFFGRYSSWAINRNFGRLQLVSSAFMAFSHGSNDAQKVMGIITLSLFSGGLIDSIDVPVWVVLLCALAMGLGTALGGWRVIRTLGMKMLRLEPVHGFAAETAATAVILGASHIGLPVSTTHVVTSTIMGVGSTRRLSAVRWGLASKIVLAWVLTLPACIGFAYVIQRFVLSKLF